MKRIKTDAEDQPEGQGPNGELTEGQKALLAAKKKKVRRGVSIAPSSNDTGADEITIEPEEEGASDAAQDEYIAPDAPLAEKPKSASRSVEKRKKTGRAAPAANPKTSPQNRK